MEEDLQILEVSSDTKGIIRCHKVKDGQRNGQNKKGQTMVVKTQKV
jgi:hypothetical protein